MVQCVRTHHQRDHGNGMLTCIQELVNMNLTLLWNLLYNKLNYAQCWLALIYDLLGYRLIPQWITINNILLFYHMKQIESLLLRFCTVIHNACLFFVLTTLWCHLWSLTEQKHENMESIFWSENLHPMLTLVIISILTLTQIIWGRSALQTDCRRPLSMGRISG